MAMAVAVFTYIDDIEHRIKRTVRRLRGHTADPRGDDDLKPPTPA